MNVFIFNIFFRFIWSYSGYLLCFNKIMLIETLENVGVFKGHIELIIGMLLKGGVIWILLKKLKNWNKKELIL